MANNRVVRAVVLACALHAAACLADVAAMPSEAVECRNAIQDIYAKFRETSLSKPESVELDTETKAKAKYIMNNLCRLVGGCSAADPDIDDGGDKKTEKESEKEAVDDCGQQPELSQQRVEAAVSARPAGGDCYDALPPVASSRQSLSGGDDDVRPPENKLSDADATLISSHVRTIESAMDAVQKIILEYVQSNCNMRSDAMTTGRPASVAAAAVAAGQTTVAARRREDFEDRDADKPDMRDVLRKMNLPLDWGGIAPPVSNVAAFASGNGQRGKNDAAAALTPPSLSSSSPPPVPKSSGILFSMFNRRTAAATSSPAKPNDSSTIA